MTQIIPTIGRIVLYCLSAADAEAINRRRTTGAAIAQRLEHGAWHPGAQAHIGNFVDEGDVVPGIVVRMYGEDCISVRAFLDGTDDFWATSISVSEGAEPGKFHWMPYQVGQAKKHAEPEPVRYRSAVDGSYVTEEFALANPDITVREGGAL